MQPRDLGRTVLLCLVGGSADAIAYLRYDTFVGAMTGNTVLLGIDLAEGRFDRAGFHLGIVAIFLAAVIVTEIALRLEIPPALPLVLTALILGGSEFIADQWSAAIVCRRARHAKRRGAQHRRRADQYRLHHRQPGQAGHRGAGSFGAQRQATVAVLTIAWIAYAAGAVAGALALHLIDYPMIVPAVLALVAAMVEISADRRAQG